MKPEPITAYADSDGTLHKSADEAERSNLRIELNTALYKEGGYEDAEELPHIDRLLPHLPLLYETLCRYPDLIRRREALRFPAFVGLLSADDTEINVPGYRRLPVELERVTLGPDLTVTRFAAGTKGLEWTVEAGVWQVHRLALFEFAADSAALFTMPLSLPRTIRATESLHVALPTGDLEPAGG